MICLYNLYIEREYSIVSEQLRVSRQKLPGCCPQMEIKIKKLYSHKRIKLQGPGRMSWGKEKMVFILSVNTNIVIVPVSP
jgi:hypothetical protein